MENFVMKVVIMTTTPGPEESVDVPIIILVQLKLVGGNGHLLADVARTPALAQLCEV